MTDIVEWLEDRSRYDSSGIYRAALDEIGRIKDEVERLHAALEKVSKTKGQHCPYCPAQEVALKVLRRP